MQNDARLSELDERKLTRGELRSNARSVRGPHSFQCPDVDSTPAWWLAHVPGKWSPDV